MAKKAPEVETLGGEGNQNERLHPGAGAVREKHDWSPWSQLSTAFFLGGPNSILESAANVESSTHPRCTSIPV